MNQIAALLHQVDAVARGMAHAEPVRRPIERHEGFECIGNSGSKVHVEGWVFRLQYTQAHSARVQAHVATLAWPREPVHEEDEAKLLLYHVRVPHVHVPCTVHVVEKLE